MKFSKTQLKKEAGGGGSQNNNRNSGERKNQVSRWAGRRGGEWARRSQERDNYAPNDEEKVGKGRDL